MSLLVVDLQRKMNNQQMNQPPQTIYLVGLFQGTVAWDHIQVVSHGVQNHSQNSWGDLRKLVLLYPGLNSVVIKKDIQQSLNDVNCKFSLITDVCGFAKNRDANPLSYKCVSLGSVGVCF